jgi:hypothetical protein
VVTIVDSTRHEPAITVRAFPITQSERFWSSSEYLDGRDSAYQVDFEKGGALLKGNITDEHDVRCVR